MRKRIQAHMPWPFHNPAPTLACSRSLTAKTGTSPASFTDGVHE